MPLSLFPLSKLGTQWGKRTSAKMQTGRPQRLSAVTATTSAECAMFAQRTHSDVNAVRLPNELGIVPMSETPLVEKSLRTARQLFMLLANGAEYAQLLQVHQGS